MIIHYHLSLIKCQCVNERLPRMSIIETLAEKCKLYSTCWLDVLFLNSGCPYLPMYGLNSGCPYLHVPMYGVACIFLSSLPSSQFSLLLPSSPYSHPIIYFSIPLHVDLLSSHLPLLYIYIPIFINSDVIWVTKPIPHVVTQAQFC